MREGCSEDTCKGHIPERVLEEPCEGGGKHELHEIKTCLCGSCEDYYCAKCGNCPVYLEYCWED